MIYSCPIGEISLSNLLLSVLHCMATNPKKNPSSRHQIPPLKLFASEDPESSPQTIQTTAFDFPQELDDETLLLKTQQALIVRSKKSRCT